MLTSRQENERTLSALLGLTDEEARGKLRHKVFVSATAAAADFAKDLVDVLGRTVDIASSAHDADVEMAIGVRPSSSARIRLCASTTPRGVTFYRAQDAEAPTYRSIPGLARRISACYAAGFVISHVIGEQKLAGLPDPFLIDFGSLGLNPALLEQSIKLEDTVLVGGGGVANGFLWGLQELKVSGSLVVVDPKNVGDGNLNRCLFFSAADVGKSKAQCLRANAAFGDLKLDAFVGEFSALLDKMGRVRMAISTVDSRRGRRSIQLGLPLEVLDASTTDISEVVIHSHSQPTADACLACVYAHIPQEDQRERDIANGLGVAVEDVQKDFIDAVVAEKIVRAHPDLSERELIGLSLFSLFKARCAEGLLRTTEGKQVLAPFGFISNLAGSLLALELALVQNGGRARGASEYMTLDPWRPPHARARRRRSRNPDCAFCGKPSALQGFSAVWPEVFSGTAP